jgi:alkylation response protein AidB-like acyl-CoA dehydrogenase
LLQQVWQRSRELGFYGMTLPEALGGAGFGVLDHVLVKEAVYASGSRAVAARAGRADRPAARGRAGAQATPEQLQRFILPVARAEMAICFAITEPEAGSDAGAVQTRAVRDGDDYVLTAASALSRARPSATPPSSSPPPATTRRGARPRPSSSSAAGLALRVEGGYKTMAGQTSTATSCWTAAASPWPTDRRTGAGPGRWRWAASPSTGCCTARPCWRWPRLALDDARAYAAAAAVRPADRRLPGHPAPAGRHGHRPGGGARADAGRGPLLDAGVEARAEASMAKLFCSETAFRIADRAVQVLGGEGIVQGRRVEWLFRMLRMYRVLTGTSEIQRNTIARELLAPAATA